MANFSRLLIGFLSPLSAALSLGGCVSTTGEPAKGSIANGGLAATSWRLLSFQSMDDSQGTTKAGNRTYLLNFNADGSLAAQLDCNRGSASWNEDISNATGGTLTIGPVTATRALCPPPSMGEMLAARLPDVASYTLRDGHLFLALKMDGGIFEFAPQ